LVSPPCHCSVICKRSQVQPLPSPFIVEEENTIWLDCWWLSLRMHTIETILWSTIIEENTRNFRISVSAQYYMKGRGGNGETEKESIITSWCNYLSSGQKGKVIPMHAWRHMEAWPHSFLTSAPDGDEWSASCPGHIRPKKRDPGSFWTGGWVSPTQAVWSLWTKEKSLAPCKMQTMIPRLSSL
jgi:hypothetical protein